MKFIFPQNYNFSSKFLGFIDYSTLFFNLFWYVIVFCLVNLLTFDLLFKIPLFILLCFPLFLFSIIGFNNENIVYVFIYVAKYFFSPKIYLYK